MALVFSPTALDCLSHSRYASFSHFFLWSVLNLNLLLCLLGLLLVFIGTVSQSAYCVCYIGVGVPDLLDEETQLDNYMYDYDVSDEF